MDSTINTLQEMSIQYSPKVPALKRPKITTVKDAYNVFLTILDLDNLNVKEEAVVIFLNRANRVVGYYKLSSGGITETVVDIRLILSLALKSLTCSIMIAHTHPSGELKPSKPDLALTMKLKEASRCMDILLLDHLIISSEGYYSFAEEGVL